VFSDLGIVVSLGRRVDAEHLADRGVAVGLRMGHHLGQERATLAAPCVVLEFARLASRRIASASSL
jgi:hypothetical protein